MSGRVAAAEACFRLDDLRAGAGTGDVAFDPISPDDLGVREYVAELLDCYRHERADLLARGGWRETAESEAVGACIAHLRGLLHVDEAA